ncbi:MAG: hypothetical protein CMJ52_01325 [Planctomycetaceae bacterium]|nr:hypothetical protein [Planctomycetaceae bacterium]
MAPSRQNLAIVSRIVTGAFVCIASMFAMLGLLALLGFFGLADAAFEEKIAIGGSFILGAFTSGLVAIILFALGTEVGGPAPNRCVRCDYDLRGVDGCCPECGRDQPDSSTDVRAEN